MKCQTFKLKKEKQSMKKLIVLAALAAAAFTTPVLARDFSGLRLELATESGDVDVKNRSFLTGLTQSATLGYDVQNGKVVVGVDATATEVFDRTDFGLGARVGYAFNENVLAYTRVGYTNLDIRTPCKCNNGVAEGVEVGAGLEANVVGPFFVKAEYRYTDYEGGLSRQGGVLAAGVRF
jgi:outer membrane immunogenic protein